MKILAVIAASVLTLLALGYGALALLDAGTSATCAFFDCGLA